MGEKITLKLNNPRPNEDLGFKKAVEAKKSSIETMDEAWARILAMKNSAADERRLREVKQAMDDDIIGRDPDDMYNARGALKKFSKAEALRLWQTLDDMRAKERLREMVDSTPDNYRLVTTSDEFYAMLDELLNEELIVFDVETTGTDVYSDKIVGHVISATSVDMHYYVPTDHDDVGITQLDRVFVTEELRQLYENPNIGLIAHNAKNLVL